MGLERGLNLMHRACIDLCYRRRRGCRIWLSCELLGVVVAICFDKLEKKPVVPGATILVTPERLPHVSLNPTASQHISTRSLFLLQSVLLLAFIRHLQQS